MFTDEASCVEAPQRTVPDAVTCKMLDGTGCGRVLVTLTVRRSPGETKSVGSSLPSGVVKQNNVRPSESTVLRYARSTVSTPSRLDTPGGSVTKLPAAKRGQGLLACAKAGRCAITDKISPANRVDLFIIIPPVCLGWVIRYSA